MKAVDYLKEKARMTNNCDTCRNCPLDNVENMMTCIVLESKYPEKAVEIVEKWAKENPAKTYLSVLLEKLPNAKVLEGSFARFCPNTVFNTNEKCPSANTSCKDCWNREYKED